MNLLAELLLAVSGREWRIGVSGVTSAMAKHKSFTWCLNTPKGACALRIVEDSDLAELVEALLLEGEFGVAKGAPSAFLGTTLTTVESFSAEIEAILIMRDLLSSLGK